MGELGADSKPAPPRKGGCAGIYRLLDFPQERCAGPVRLADGRCLQDRRPKMPINSREAEDPAGERGRGDPLRLKLIEEKGETSGGERDQGRGGRTFNDRPR